MYSTHKTKKTIKGKLEKIIPNLAQKYHLDFLILFGSYARDKVRRNSDIDIGIGGKIDFHDELKFAGELSNLLETNHLDLVNLYRASPFLGNFATREALLVYEKQEGIFANFRTYIFKRFVETKPLRSMKFKRTLDYVRKNAPISTI